MDKLFGNGDDVLKGVIVTSRGNITNPALGMRRCSMCKEWKGYNFSGNRNPANEFIQQKTRGDGWRAECKVCYKKNRGDDVRKENAQASALRELKYGSAKWFVYVIIINITRDGYFERFYYIGRTSQMPHQRLCDHLNGTYYGNQYVYAKLLENALCYVGKIHEVPMRYEFIYFPTDAKNEFDARVCEQAKMDEWSAKEKIHRMICLNRRDEIKK